MQGCFDILVPKNETEHPEFDFEALLRGEVATPSQHQDAKKDLLSHGLGSNRYRLTIHLSKDTLKEDLQETQENQVLFDQLRESLTVLESKHTPEIQHWLQTLTKMDQTDKTEKEVRLKRLIDLKSLAIETTRKARMLGIEPLVPKTDGLEAIEDEFDNEDFEEVDIQAEVRERKQKARVPPLQRLFPLSGEPEMNEDPTYVTPRQALE
ncbi:hypothetical protein BY458DRAFT_439738 [Sporodiniella umbellata]|nr:hypothetical protein BY458DRAFT_439738 [Sporodiniella umbellata]